LQLRHLHPRTASSLPEGAALRIAAEVTGPAGGLPRGNAGLPDLPCRNARHAPQPVAQSRGGPQRRSRRPPGAEPRRLSSWFASPPAPTATVLAIDVPAG